MARVDELVGLRNTTVGGAFPRDSRRSRAAQRDSENARIDDSSRRQHAAERELDRIVRKALAEDGRRGQQLDLFGDLS
ncbi:MAG: hypothetical protein K0R62_7305 [Nonomuraea muscovyensis]|nr:hypothetical protein [Nonomuraea muscovyensis]